MTDEEKRKNELMQQLMDTMHLATVIHKLNDKAADLFAECLTADLDRVERTLEHSLIDLGPEKLGQRSMENAGHLLVLTKHLIKYRDGLIKDSPTARNAKEHYDKHVKNAN